MVKSPESLDLYCDGLMPDAPDTRPSEARTKTRLVVGTIIVGPVQEARSAKGIQVPEVSFGTPDMASANGPV